MRPRNLRKPTPARVRYYWRDFVFAWRMIGAAYAQDCWLAEEPE